jgi:hypothetical protein
MLRLCFELVHIVFKVLLYIIIMVFEKDHRFCAIYIYIYFGCKILHYVDLKINKFYCNIPCVVKKITKIEIFWVSFVKCLLKN